MTPFIVANCNLKALVVKKARESYETSKFSVALHVKHVLIRERLPDLPTPS
jgi:hypothetical protein